MIRRAAEHAEGRVGDSAMSQHAPLQVLARARAQEIDRVATSLLLVGQGVAVRWIRLHVVEGGDRRGGVAKGGMVGDVVDPLAADIDDTPVAQRFQMLFARAQHRPLLVWRQNSSMSDGGGERLTAGASTGCSLSFVGKAGGRRSPWHATTNAGSAIVFCMRPAASSRP